MVGTWESGIALSQEGRGQIPLGVRAKVCVGEQQVLGMRGWLEERTSVLENTEVVRKEKTKGWGEDLIQFSLCSERNVIKWKRSGKVGQVVLEEGLGLPLCPGFRD